MALSVSGQLTEAISGLDYFSFSPKGIQHISTVLPEGVAERSSF